MPPGRNRKEWKWMAIARAEMGDADRQEQNAKTRKHKVKATTPRNEK